jgi:hypothetical protein
MVTRTKENLQKNLVSLSNMMNVITPVNEEATEWVNKAKIILNV